MSDSDEETAIRYGTPLDAYDEDELPKKKSSQQDVREQYAVDSQGKRRFHGAFTGGFTAGYGNTVAAPEGWQPSTFKSSRQQRNAIVQRAEDFMDEEDRGEFGIAPREIQPNTDFAGHKRKRQRQFHDGPIPGVPVLEAILQPAHETVAVRILRSMGWRPGKGVGEKVTARERNTKRKVIGCYVPQEFRPQPSAETQATSDHSSSDSEDEVYSSLLFEPDDLELLASKPKNDCFGLGYVGLSKRSVLGGVSGFEGGDGEWGGSHLVTMDKGRKVSIRGQAFGVGALEEEDEDIYAREDMTNYDFVLGGTSKEKGGNKKGKVKETKGEYKKVLEGFVAASKPCVPPKSYPPPALPRDYTPTPPKPSRFSLTKIGCPEAPPVRDRGLGRHDLSAKHRGQILGEETRTPEPSKPKEADPQIPSLEDRLAGVLGRTVNFVGDQENVGSEQVSKEGSGKFKPFASNPEKQKRYEMFVALKDRGLKGSDGGSGKDRLSQWEREREAREFEQAYKLYRPLSGFMGDRFVSATHTDEENSALQRSQELDLSKYADPDKIEAARLGMFGRMTRETVRWMPESLLCKRFNVPEPYDGGYASQGKEKKKTSYSIFEYLETSAHDRNSYLREQTEKGKEAPSTSGSNKDTNTLAVERMEVQDEESQRPKRLTAVDLFLQEKEKEKETLLKKPQLNFQKEIAEKKEDKEVTETIDKFDKIDLYKAVFLSDSESESEEKDEKEGKKEKAEEKSEDSEVRKRKTRFDSPPKNVERNKSPPKGIFANLDFDRLNSWQQSSTRKEEDCLIVKSVPDAGNNVQESKKIDERISRNTSDVNKEECYGPKLPVKHVFKASKDRLASEIPEKHSDNSTNASDDDEESYGPRIPEKHIFKLSSDRLGPELPEKHIFKASNERLTSALSSAISVDSSSSSSDSSDGWVDASLVKSKESKKKNKKLKKSKKSKHKTHKHKKKSDKKHKKKKH